MQYRPRWKFLAKMKFYTADHKICHKRKFLKKYSAPIIQRMINLKLIFADVVVVSKFK
jgi:hypothetical protein